MYRNNMVKNKITTKQLYCWDGTIPMISITKLELQIVLCKIAKKGVFQGEEGITNKYQHWQVRISLKVKWIMATLIKNCKNLGLTCRWSPTSNENKNNYDYVTKDNTKIIDAVEINEKHYITRQVREMKVLLPFQKSIIDKLDNWDTRYINYVYQKKGKVGKSRLCSYIRDYKLGKVLPTIFENGKDLMRIVMCVPTNRNYFFDMPKAMKKENLCGFYSAIEEIKNGYAWDDRYTFKEKTFDCPNIWIFSNQPPNLNWLSMDRWIFWTVNNTTLKLEEFNMNEMIELSNNKFNERIPKKKYRKFIYEYEDECF